MTKQKYVIFCGEVFRWEEKQPYTRSGKSIHGGLEADRDTKTVRCHVCGKWFSSLSGHLKLHGVSAREYRETYGLGSNAPIEYPSITYNRSTISKANAPTSPTALVALKRGLAQYRADVAAGLRTAYRASRASSESRNIKGICREQTLAAIRTKADGKNAPTMRLLSKVYQEAASFHFGSWTGACVAAGLRPHTQGGPPISDVALLDSLRDFYVLNGRVPTQPDFKVSARLFGYGTYFKRYGSISAALAAAGLSLVSPKVKE